MCRTPCSTTDVYWPPPQHGVEWRWVITNENEDVKHSMAEKCGWTNSGFIKQIIINGFIKQIIINGFIKYGHLDKLSNGYGRSPDT